MRSMMDEFGVHLGAASYGADVKPLLKEACAKIFGSAGGLVDMLVRHVPSSRAATAAKVERCYTGGGGCWGRVLGVGGWVGAGGVCKGGVEWSAGGTGRRADSPTIPTAHTHVPLAPLPPPAGPQDSELAAHMRACNPRGPLVVYICKLFPKADCSAFDAFGRIMSGTVKPGDKVCVWACGRAGGGQCAACPLLTTVAPASPPAAPPDPDPPPLLPHTHTLTTGAGAGRGLHPRGRGGLGRGHRERRVGIPGALPRAPGAGGGRQLGAARGLGRDE